MGLRKDSTHLINLRFLEHPDVLDMTSLFLLLLFLGYCSIYSEIMNQFEPITWNCKLKFKFCLRIAAFHFQSMTKLWQITNTKITFRVSEYTWEPSKIKHIWKREVSIRCFWKKYVELDIFIKPRNQIYI